MRRFLLTGLVFAVAAFTNTLSVVLQQRGTYFTRWFGQRGWYVHLALVLPLWVLLLALIPGAGRRLHWPLPAALRPFGLPLLLGAAFLWLALYRQLGDTRTANGNLFGHGSQERVTGGVFRFRANPMYDSYVLALVGLALRRRNAVYLLLAGEAAVLCHGIEAHAENRFLPGERRPWEATRP